MAEVAVAAKELGPVAAHGPGGVVHVEKRDPVAEFRIVGIAGEQRARLRLDFRSDVHDCFGPHVSQHPFHVSCSREPPRPARAVAHFQDGEFNGPVYVHIDPRLRDDPTLDVFEHRVAEPVPRDIRGGAPAGSGMGDQKWPRLFVTKIKSLPSGITHRIVVPGSEAELMGVLAPRVGRTAFRNHGAEVGVCQHVHPWRRRHLPRGQW